MKSALACAVLLAVAVPAASAETFHGVEMLPKPPEGVEMMDNGWDVGTKVGTVLAVIDTCGKGFVTPELRSTIIEARDAYRSDWMFQQAYKMAWVSTEVAARSGGNAACYDALTKLQLP